MRFGPRYQSAGQPPALARLRAGGGARSLVTPANFQFITYGDSRSEDGIGSSFGAAGYAPLQTSKGIGGWLTAVSGGRLIPGIYPNFGIAGGTAGQAAVEPRLPNATFGTSPTAGTWYRGSQTGTQASPTGGGSDNKGYTYAKNHDAGIIFLLLGTNSDGDYAVATRNNITTILNGIGTSKLVVILNETPKGILPTGAVSQPQLDGSTQAFKDYSDWLKTLDFASGSPNSRTNVLVADTWAEFVDGAASPPAGFYYNKVNYLRDALHFTQYGALRAAEVAVARIASAYGAGWTATPSLVPLPTGNALAATSGARSAAMPFINSNPNLAAGTNGTVSSTWATAPLASGVPQGWTISGTNVSGLAVVCTKGTVDANGFNEWTVQVSGTLANNLDATVILSQVVAFSTYESQGLIAAGDSIKAMARVSLDAGSALCTGASVACFVNGTPTTSVQLALAGAEVSAALGTLSGTLEGGGRGAQLFMTDVIDRDNPNIPALTTTLIQVKVNLGFGNYTGASASVSGTFRVTAGGIFRVGP